MNYNFKTLYKEMFTEHWKLSLTILLVVEAVIGTVLIHHGQDTQAVQGVLLGFSIGLITLKAINTLIRALLLILGCKKGHRLSIEIYHEWVR